MRPANLRSARLTRVGLCIAVAVVLTLAAAAIGVFRNQYGLDKRVVHTQEVRASLAAVRSEPA